MPHHSHPLIIPAYTYKYRLLLPFVNIENHLVLHSQISGRPSFFVLINKMWHTFQTSPTLPSSFCWFSFFWLLGKLKKIFAWKKEGCEVNYFLLTFRFSFYWKGFGVKFFWRGFLLLLLFISMLSHEQWNLASSKEWAAQDWKEPQAIASDILSSYGFHFIVFVNSERFKIVIFELRMQLSWRILT